MLISAVGWNRNAGENIIVDEDVSESIFIPRRKANSFEQKSNKMYSFIDGEGSFVFTIGPRALRLNGDYNLTLKFSEEDIIKMFKELIKEMSGEDILGLISDVD